MPSWNEVLIEINNYQKANPQANPLDHVRRKYLKELFEKTNRNVIAYYSGWLAREGVRGVDITDSDKNAFMAAIHKLDRTKGLDLILHTPGGNVAATESLVDYLRIMFGNNIRAIIPQLAMSAGTMIACACKEIIMGKPSNLGPIDPQFGGIAAHGVIDEFKKAKKEIKKDPSTIPIWQVVIGKYHPTFIGECENAIKWSKEIVEEWLKSGMFCDEKRKNPKVKKIVKELSDHGKTKSHSRHIGLNDCIKLGLKVSKMEEMEDDLQDTILTIHHTYMHTFSNSLAIKIVENHLGYAMINQARSA
jgi:ATP-dependent protease ClpP protease subunit